MPDKDEDEAAGAWSRPDGGVDPADYVETDSTPAASGPTPEQSDEPTMSGTGAEIPDDPTAPGDSLIGNGDGDAVEPNEPG